jgi:hypothetical protein
MANEFIIKNGFQSQGNSIITGSLTVTKSIIGSIPFVDKSYFVQGILPTDQRVDPGIDVTIEFVDQYDPQSWWDASTFQFTPTVAGYYNITLGVWFDPANDLASQLNMQARINGNSFMIVQQPTINNPGSGNSLIGTKIQYFNGSTDYADFVAYNGTSNPLNIRQGTAAGSGTWFSAIRLNV